jgi:hypothetical protein
MDSGPHFEFGKGCASCARHFLALPKFAQRLYKVDHEEIDVPVRRLLPLRQHGRICKQ